MDVGERVPTGERRAAAGDRVDDSVGQAVEGEGGGAEGGLREEDAIHVGGDAGEGGGVDGVEVEGVDGVVVAFDAGGAVEAEAGGGFEGGVGDLSDVGAEGVEGQERGKVRLCGGGGPDVDDVEEDEGLGG